MLKITNGPLTGRIWIQNGEVIDAEAGEAGGEAAFHRILGWRSGSFESLSLNPTGSGPSPIPTRACCWKPPKPRTRPSTWPVPKPGTTDPRRRWRRWRNMRESSFVLALKPVGLNGFDAHGLENPQPMADWGRHTLDDFARWETVCRRVPFTKWTASGRSATWRWRRTRTGISASAGSATFPRAKSMTSMKKVLSLWAC